MTKKIIKPSLFILFLLPIANSWAQTLEKGESKEIRLVSDTTIIVTRVKEARLFFNTNTETPYYWCQGREIHTNLGGIGGPLLHGKYYCYTKDNQLIEQGKFRCGRKQGTWKKWDRKGNLMEVSHWKKGRLQGKYYHFQNDQVLIVKYRKGKLITKPWYIPSFLVKKNKPEETTPDIEQNEQTIQSSEN